MPIAPTTSIKVGVAHKRRDKYNRGYIYVQIGEQGRTYRFHLFPNTQKAAKHEPDYIAYHLEHDPEPRG